MKLNSYIDHTILKAEATSQEVKKLYEEAKQYKFASICVNTCFTELVSSELKGSDVKTCVVVGFPLGAMSTEAKAFEAKSAVAKGAQEADMVINVGSLKEKNYDFVLQDIKAVVDASRPAIVKVILETCLLTDEEKVKACQFSVKAGAAFKKELLSVLLDKQTADFEKSMKAERIWREEEKKRRAEEQKRLQEETERRRLEFRKKQEEAEKERKQRQEEARQRRKKEEAERRIEMKLRDEDFKRNMKASFSQQQTQVRDATGNRYCGLIAKESEFTSYGGQNHVNLGTCKTCS